MIATPRAALCRHLVDVVASQNHHFERAGRGLFDALRSDNFASAAMVLDSDSRHAIALHCHEIGLLNSDLADGCIRIGMIDASSRLTTLPLHQNEHPVEGRVASRTAMHHVLQCLQHAVVQRGQSTCLLTVVRFARWFEEQEREFIDLVLEYVDRRRQGIEYADTTAITDLLSRGSRECLPRFRDMFDPRCDSRHHVRVTMAGVDGMLAILIDRTQPLHAEFVAHHALYDLRHRVLCAVEGFSTRATSHRI